jgi:hypothetical protein
MGTGEKKCKEMSLQKYVMFITVFMAASVLPSYLILKTVILFHIYEEPFFYLSMLAIIIWWGISITICLKLRDAGKVRIVGIVGVIEVMLGIFGVLALDTILGYKIVLSISFILVLVLWEIIRLLYKMILQIRRGHGH